jgi:hypothetical protein
MRIYVYESKDMWLSGFLHINVPKIACVLHVCVHVCKSTAKGDQSIYYLFAVCMLSWRVGRIFR